MKLHAIFQDCVGQEAGRYQIQTPWVAHGFAWATDGRISVRVPTVEPDTPAVGGCRWPDARALPWAVGAPGPALPLPDAMPEPIFPPCGMCWGSRQLWTPRKKQYDCPECEGSGYDDRERFHCYALSREPWLAISAKYLRILVKHGVRSVSPLPSTCGNGASIFRFSLGEVTGLVAGLCRADDNPQWPVTDIRNGRIVAPVVEAMP